MSLVDLGKKLLEASRLGIEDEVKTLMASGAPFTTDWLGTSPLHLAAYAGHLPTAEVLLKAGVSRDARTKVDRTPLHLAAQEGQKDIVQLLLHHGADINAKDMLKMTPLHWAVERLHPAVVKLLLENGADPNFVNKFNKTPLGIAIDHQHQPVIELLETALGIHEDVAIEEAPCIYITTTSQDPLSACTNPTPAATALQSFVTAAAKAKSNSKAKSDGVLLRPLTAGIPTVATTGSSTSVLATLAALAEASTPLGQIGSDSSQTYTLTEAGKLALSWKDAAERCSRNLGSTETNQKVITIVQSSDGQSDITSNDIASMETSVSVNDPPPVTVTFVDDCLEEYEISKCNKEDSASLQQQLESAQKQAEQYKLQLAAKEQEAENYRKKLQEMSGSTCVEST